MEILGLIDAIEATILDSPRLPFSDKIVIKEKKILEMLGKLRMVAQTGGEAAQRAVKGEPMPRQVKRHKKVALQEEPKQESSAVSPAAQQTIEHRIDDAKLRAETLKQGADKYAEEVLNQLLVVTTKIQRTLENGKTRLEKNKQA